MSGEEITYRYDAFGTLIEANGEADNSITYAGYQYDVESGLYYLNARYYDSTTARFLTEDTYAGQANDPLSLNRYTYCANNPLRYTDPSGHFFGAVLRFVGGAVIGGGIEFITQKFIEKREKVDWKAVLYEGVVGGVTAVIGGVGGTAGKVGKTEKTLKTVAKGALKTGVKEGIGGFVEDVGYQVFVEDKSLDEVDYGQAAKAGATAGVTAMADEVLDAVAPKKQVSTKNKKKTSQATGLIADVADDTPSPRVKADAVPEGKVKGTVAGSTDGISKNQKKMQSQTVDRSCLAAKKTTIGVTSIAENNAIRVENITKNDILNFIDGVTEQSTKIAEEIRKKEIGINILSDKRFEEWTGAGSNTIAVQVKKQIYLRKSADPASLFSSVVHEGTHVLDYIDGIPEDVIGGWAGEMRAYTEERLFQLNAKLPVDFLDVNDMKVHIWMNYER